MTTQAHSPFASLWEMTLMGLHYLNGRRLRTLLTTLAIVFGVGMIFSINLILPGIQDAFKQTLSSVTGADISVASVAGESFTTATLDQIAGVDQVSAVTGILRRKFSLPTLANDDSLGSTTQITLIGIDPATVETVHPFIISEGRFLQTGDMNKVVLPAGFADLAPELHVGTIFPLVTAAGLRLYTVVGFLADQGDPSAPEMYVTLPDAQSALGQPDLINTVEVSIDTGADRDVVGAAILNAVGTGYTLNANSGATDTLAALNIGLAMFNLMGLMALFLGAFLIFNTFRTIVVERRRDLALLRAVGATRQQITTMILIESLLQGLLGTLIGLVVGFGLAAAALNFMNSLYSKYFHMGALQLQLNAPAVFSAVLLGVLTALVAGYFPARAAGRVSPLDALRPATAGSVNRAARWSLIAGAVIMVIAVLLLLSGSQGAVGGALLFLFGMVIAAPGLVLPVANLFSPLLTLWYAREGDLARGNLTRQPGRAAITGSTLMIGLATLVLMAALVASFAALITDLSDANFSSDIILLPQSIGVYNNVVGADQSLATQLRALPEVQTVGTMRYAMTAYAGQQLQVMGINPDEYRQVASFNFSEGDPDASFAALDSGRNLIITSLALTQLNLHVGDDIVLDTAEGAQTYHIVGAANDLMSFKVVTVFISHANMAADFHKTEDILLMLTLQPGADKAAALADVQQIAADYPQFTPHLTGEYRAELEGYTNSAFGLFYFIAALILFPAALGLLNTLTINILERTREIGVLRAVGGSRTQVRRMVMAEALLLGIFGAAMGVLAGVAMSYGFIGAFSMVGWSMPYFFPTAGIIAAVIVGVLLALFAAILPARSVAKLDIIRALQYE